VEHLPLRLRERLEAVGITKTLKLSFRNPPPAAVEFVHRTHPLVATLADHIAETTLADEETDVAARSGAIFTKAVTTRTTAYLLRLRCQITVEERDGKIFRHRNTLLSEECVVLAAKGGSTPEVLGNAEALSMVAAEPAKNMDPGMRQQHVFAAVAKLADFQAAFDQIANRRAEELLADHRRVREASEVKGIRYSVAPCLPVDVIGVYVLLPSQN
jgi:hypothetical protein